MVRGTTRKMLYLPARAGDFFTEAYFVLREGAAPVGEQDLLSRAEEIAEGVFLPPPPKGKRRLSAPWLFSLGVLLGGAVTALGLVFF